MFPAHDAIYEQAPPAPLWSSAKCGIQDIVLATNLLG